MNPELLKIPEDELELHMHNVPIRDVIRLMDYKERQEVHYYYYYYFEHFVLLGVIGYYLLPSLVSLLDILII